MKSLKVRIGRNAQEEKAKGRKSPEEKAKCKFPESRKMREVKMGKRLWGTGLWVA